MKVSGFCIGDCVHNKGNQCYYDTHITLYKGECCNYDSKDNYTREQPVQPKPYVCSNYESYFGMCKANNRKETDHGCNHPDGDCCCSCEFGKTCGSVCAEAKQMGV